MAEIAPEKDIGRKLSGQRSNTPQQYNAPRTPFTERTVPYTGPEDARVTGYEGAANTEIEPIDASFARVRIYDTTGVGQTLSGQASTGPQSYNTAQSKYTEIVVAYSGASNNRVTGYEGDPGVEIRAIDSDYAMVRVYDLSTVGAVLNGQQANNQESFILPFTERVVPYSGPTGARVTGYEGDDNVEISPIDDNYARVRTFNVAAIATALASVSMSVPTTVDRIDLPPVLTGVTVTYNTSENTGDDNHPASQADFIIFGTGSGGLSPNASAQAGAAVIPDVQVEITERYHVNVPAMEHTFYLPSGSNMAAVLAKLTELEGATVEAWPQFRPEAHTLTANGQQVSVSVKASTRVNGGGSTDSGQSGYEWGNGSSKESGLTTKTIRIPPTIHGEIAIEYATESATASVEVDASTPLLFPGSPAAQPAITNTKSAEATAEAAVTPTTLAATTPAEIPATGLYMKTLRPGPMVYGGAVTIFQAIVVNFADL